MERPLSRRCYRCFRPLPLCFCRAIPRIDNRTGVLILQHIGERFHRFNTARIVRGALRNCQLIAAHNRRLATYDLPIQANAGLLYPGAAARALTEIPVTERPSQLVIIDGTWHQAKTIVRDVPQLRDLPCYQLTPSSPGQYRIRREPNATSLSTLEATVAALQALEPDTSGLDQLLTAFHEMVDNQIRQSAGRNARRQNNKRQSRPRHFPQLLVHNTDNLVVAYGEATPGRPGQLTDPPSPVHWVAQRLSTAERFARLVRPPQPLSDVVLNQMRLSSADFDGAASQAEFCTDWRRFFRPDDVLIVYHQRTYQLLRPLDAAPPRFLVLKAIFGQWRSGFQSVEELLITEGVPLPNGDGKSRAHHRLDMAVALVEHLLTRYGKLP